MAQQPMTLDQMMQAYQKLTSDFKTKRMDKATYSAALVQLRAIDSEKRWWSCTPDGNFVWYDGKRWLPGQPPIAKTLGTTPSQPSVRPASPTTGGRQTDGQKAKSPLKGWRKIASTPILAILPGFLVGSVWFLFTLLQTIFGEGVGVDFLTPVILTGVPLFLWLLRKPIDKILYPLHKILGAFPFVLRLLLALIVPMMFGCGCSMIATTGYLSLHFTALISTVFGYVLLRTPTVKKIL